NTKQLKGLMEEEAVRVAFQADFSRYGTRLLRLFEVGKKIGHESGKRIGTKLLASEVLDELVVPLLDDELDSFTDNTVLVQLVSALTDFVLSFDGTCRKDSIFLHRLASKPRFLELFASCERGSRVFTALCEEQFFYRSVETTRTVARRLAELCASCVDTHG